jgi:hypothetical protein
MLPYVIWTPAVFGFSEWNGRSLTDNAPNVMFPLAANTPISLGIGKESVTSKPSQAELRSTNYSRRNTQGENNEHSYKQRRRNSEYVHHERRNLDLL